MKLTQKWMNGSCDNYDQNSNKNESQCNQTTTKTSRNPKRSKIKKQQKRLGKNNNKKRAIQLDAPHKVKTMDLHVSV